MKQFLSIGTILSTITSLLVLMLVSNFAVLAFGAFDRQREAAHVVTVVNITRNAFSAKETIRLEGGVVHAALLAPERASAEVIAHVFNLHSKADITLMSMANQFRTQLANGTSPILIDFLKSKTRYDAVFLLAAAAMRLPETQRPEKSRADWRAAADKLTAEVERLSRMRDRNDADTFINDMMRISDAVWLMRLDAGIDRENIGSVIQEGRALSAAHIQQFAESSGRINARWADIEEYAAQSNIPPQLQAAIARARNDYFVQFRAVRTKAIADLVAGKPVPISGYDWLKISNPGANSITAISKIALDLTEVHAAKQAAIAVWNFYVAIALMFLSIGLASFTTMYVMWRVIRPLKRITQSMKTVTDGDLEQTIPFSDRNDEIGQFSRALWLFRDGAAEQMRLKSEMIRNLAAKELAERSDRTKSDFLANMSHELRTPLNAIIGFSQMIETEIYGPGLPRYRDYATDIHGAGKHLLCLINDILDLSKLEAGKLDLHVERVDLADLIRESAHLMRGRAMEQSLRLTLDIGALPPLFIDRLRTKQILLNLLSNAIKFTPKQGVILVQAGLDTTGHVVVCVRDSGIGIPPEMIALAFEPFRQIDSTLAREFDGTGLGLPLVKKLIELHGGEVTLESTLNVGTCVFISFPATRCMEAAETA